MTTSTLVGLVRDTSNAVIPGATVVATHEGTGVAREGVTDANGEFVLLRASERPVHRANRADRVQDDGEPRACSWAPARPCVRSSRSKLARLPKR